MLCNQSNCGIAAAFRFTWPGRDEAGICWGHAPKLKATADAMGMHLQLIPIQMTAEEALAMSEEKTE